MKSCSRENLDAALKDPSVLNLIGSYQLYEKSVLQGHLGKTAAFWMSFINHCHLSSLLGENKQP